MAQNDQIAKGESGGQPQNTNSRLNDVSMIAASKNYALLLREEEKCR
jgi:hypothetical protein